MTKKKKTNKRSKEKYPALVPHLNLKTRTELIDYDYINKLTDKEKAWLNKFTEEYTNASVKKDKRPLHKTKDLERDCYNRNNARNRDILTRAKASGNMVDYEGYKHFIGKVEEESSSDRPDELTFDELYEFDDPGKKSD